MRPDLMRTTCLCRFMATRMVDRLNSGEPPGFRENMLNLFHPHVPMEVEDIERNSCVRIMHLALQTPGDRDVQAWILRTLLHQVLWRQVLLEALHRQGPCWPPTEKELQVWGLTSLDIATLWSPHRNRPLPWQMIFHALISKPGGASRPQILHFINTNYNTQQVSPRKTS